MKKNVRKGSFRSGFLQKHRNKEHKLNILTDKFAEFYFLLEN